MYVALITWKSTLLTPSLNKRLDPDMRNKIKYMSRQYLLRRFAILVGDNILEGDIAS